MFTPACVSARHYTWACSPGLDGLKHLPVQTVRCKGTRPTTRHLLAAFLLAIWTVVSGSAVCSIVFLVTSDARTSQNVQGIQSMVPPRNVSLIVCLLHAAFEHLLQPLVLLLFESRNSGRGLPEGRPLSPNPPQGSFMYQNPCSRDRH